MKKIIIKTRKISWISFVNLVLYLVCGCNNNIDSTTDMNNPIPLGDNPISETSETKPTTIIHTPTPLVEKQDIEIPLENMSDSQIQYAQEFLVIWGIGTQDDDVNDCLLWIVDPVHHELFHPNVETKWCNFTISTFGDESRLISYPPYSPYSDNQSAEIIVYHIAQGGDLQITQKIPLGELRITSIPQWGNDNFIYFSAIDNGQEQIFQFDSINQIITPYLVSENGFATNPKMSHDGDYLAYEVLNNHNSRDDCSRQTCYSQSINVWDIRANHSLDLIFPDELSPLHQSLQCEPEWSGDKNLLAFELGCAAESPFNSVAVFDAHTQKMTLVGDVNNSVATKSGWYADNELILRGTIQLLDSDAVYSGYVVYSRNGQLNEMHGLPLRNKTDYDSIYFNDWSTDTQFAVGSTQVEGETRTVMVVLANSWDSLSSEIYLESPDDSLDNPLWSPTNKWIAYRSYNWETRVAESRFVLLELENLVQSDIGVMKIASPSFFWYSQQ